MTDSPQQARRDETYHALGAFIVAFSALMHALETTTIQMLRPGRSWSLMEAALVDRTAAPIISAFFNVFTERWKDSITEDERRLLNSLRKEIIGVVEVRNRLVHDAWMTSTGGTSMLASRKRAAKDGVSNESIEYSPEILTQLYADAKRLQGCVNAFFNPLDAKPNLAEKLEIRDGKISRT